MPSPSADRNLLFGIMALQLNFITRDALIAGMNAWVLDKHKPLGQILREQSAIRADAVDLLDALVVKHLELHGGDAERSLAALTPLGDARDRLAAVADPAVQASVASVGRDHPLSSAGWLPPPLGDPGVRFRVLWPHARGGLGEVFVAEDVELRRQVALKEIQPRYAADPTSRDRFLAEAEITGNLEHPGIVPVYGLGTYADGRPFYAMRLIRGDSLKEAIERFHVGAPDFRSVEFRRLVGRVVDVCNALAYAHSRGVLHRDVKPGNVMLGKYGETLVVDWGLAKVVGRPAEPVAPDGAGDRGEPTVRPLSGSDATATKTGAVVGTPAYMAPEQAAGQVTELGPATDVYGLGAVLYTVLTGRPPATGAVSEILDAVRAGKIPPPSAIRSGVPPALAAVCRRAMALRPADRYPSATELSAELERWLADEPVTAYREPVAARARRWLRRRPRLGAALAAGLLVGLVGLAVGLVAVSREQARTADERDQKDTALRQSEADRGRTRETLRAFTDDVVERLLARRELGDPEKQFLRRVQQHYDEFAATQGDTEPARADRAYGALRVGKIRQALGDLPGAEASYRAAAGLYADLERDRPDVPAYQAGAGRARTSLGPVLFLTGRPAEAETEVATARDRLRELAAARPDPEYRADLAKASSNLGVLLDQTNRKREAAVEYRASRDAYRALADDHPADDKYRAGLAIARNNLAAVLFDLRELTEAEAEFRAAVGALRGLVAENPGERDYRESLAACHSGLGNLLYLTRRPAEAEAEHRAALDIRGPLADLYPGRPAYRVGVVRARRNLGMALHANGNPDDARVNYLAARDDAQALVASHGGVPTYAAELAGCHTAVGVVSLELKDTATAEAAFREARDAFVRLATEHPAVAEYGFEAGRAHANLARLLRGEKRAEAAEAEFVAAAERLRALVARSKGVPPYHGLLASVLGELADVKLTAKDEGAARRLLDEAGPHHRAATAGGTRYPEGYGRYLRKLAALALAQRDHVAAAASAQELAALVAAPPATMFEAAELISRCVPLGEQDAALTAAERAALTVRYADRAVALIRQAVKAGHPVDPDELEKAEAFMPAKGHETFRELLTDLRKQKPSATREMDSNL